MLQIILSFDFHVDHKLQSKLAYNDYKKNHILTSNEICGKCGGQNSKYFAMLGLWFNYTFNLTF